jgi:hypothetical protein
VRPDGAGSSARPPWRASIPHRPERSETTSKTQRNVLTYRNQVRAYTRRHSRRRSPSSLTPPARRKTSSLTSWVHPDGPSQREVLSSIMIHSSRIRCRTRALVRLIAIYRMAVIVAALRWIRNRLRRAVRRGAAWPAKRPSSHLTARSAVSRTDRWPHRRAAWDAERRRRRPQEHGSASQRAAAQRGGPEYPELAVPCQPVRSSAASGVQCPV